MNDNRSQTHNPCGSQPRKPNHNVRSTQPKTGGTQSTTPGFPNGCLLQFMTN